MQLKPELEVAEALGQDDLVFIDVRTPGEFARASIAGAINIPLFDDRQHREIGLIYHREGEAAARRTALTLASPRLPALVEAVSTAAGGKTPLLYCWRGGMRSFGLQQILNLSGIRAARLKGGYRAYRRFINRRLDNYKLKSKLLVINGLTGVGKTAIILEMIRRGRPAMDLEGLAGHRGSVFGAVGLPAQRSQKDFDALLIRHLEQYNGAPLIVVEGEGRRIGNVHLPAFLTEAIAKGLHLLVNAPLDERVRRIVQEYLPGEPSAEELEQIRRGLRTLRRRLGDTKVENMIASLSRGDYHTVAEQLCTGYYDCLYSDSREDRHRYLAVVDSSSVTEAADRICALMDHYTNNEPKQLKGVLA